jgi:hypothetical protein
LTDVRRIAADVAKEQDPRLEVVGATAGEGESTYAEVILTVRGCRAEPCRVMIGVSRDVSEPECRGNVTARLREHLAEHRANA